MTTPLTGGCLCAAVRYEVSAPVEKLIACHCTDCQHASGTGASVNAMIPSSAFRLVAGQTKVFSKPADSGHDENAWAKNRRVEIVLSDGVRA